MKLNKKIKDRIDVFFANVTAEELYEMSVRKYDFVEDVSIEITYSEIKSVDLEFYSSKLDESYSSNDEFSGFDLAA